MTHENQREILTEGCDGCELLPQCGGLPYPDWFGCFDRCHSRKTPIRRDVNGAPLTGRHSRTAPHCANGLCDWTCPNNPDVFAERWAEIGGLFDFSHERYLPLNGEKWPRYIPMIRSGPPRFKPLNCDFVALSLYESLRALSPKKGRYESPGATEFRRRLAFRDDCKIVLIGVGPDKLIEGFYAKFRELRLAEIFADLNLTAITPPNFSFFLDVPRPHSLYNRKRMLRVADEFIRHGIPIAPHFNATNKADWDFWIELLRASPELSVYCKEFQTGNRRKTNYDQTISEMIRIQESVGRPLHPILVAGKTPLPGLLPHLASFSVVDSDPSMKTNHRQILCDDRWQPIPSNPGACLTDLLDQNIAEHSRLFEQRLTQTTASANKRPTPVSISPDKMVALELGGFVSQTSPSRGESLR
jgi:hypothetical protein